MIKEINVIFDGPPGDRGGRFVDIEDENGKSIRVGKWLPVDQSALFWKLRITPLDFYTLTELELSAGMLRKVDVKNPGK